MSAWADAVVEVLTLDGFFNRSQGEVKHMKTEVIPAPSAAVVTTERVAASLREQYAKVLAAENNAFVQRVRLGGMLIQWEAYLGPCRGGRGSSGEGLKGWLEANLPELNYQAALNYKSQAKQVILMLGGGSMAVAALMGEDEVTTPAGDTVEVGANVLKRRDELFGRVDSRRKLECEYYAFMADELRGVAGRPKGSRNRAAPAAAKSAAEAAQEFWALTMDRLQGRSAALQSAAMLLTGAQAEAALTVLGDLVAALEARRDEAARG